MKNINKLVSYLIIVIFILVFSYYNFDEYKSFHLNKIETEKNKIELEEKSNNFEIDNIKELPDANFYYTPNKELLTNIVDLISNSKKEIYLETYMLTESRIQEALIKAKKRNIKIQIILEKSPYMASNINNKASENMKKNGIEVNWSNKNNYSLNHSKVLLIDDLSIVSSGNFTYSTFTQNRDFFIFTHDKAINLALKQNFKNDFLGIKTDVYDNNLIFSPGTSRIKFEKLLEKATKNVQIYFQYLLDDKLAEKLIKLKTEKNIEISIVLPDTAKKDENTKKVENSGIKVVFIKKPKIHAKAILVDEKYLYIGSINLSESSIDKNREVGILLKDNKIIEEFLDVFYNDINNNF